VNPELITLVYRLTPDSRGILPKKAQAVLEKLKLWNWGSVLSKTTVWSLAYLVLQVIYVYIYIYMSVLSKTTVWSLAYLVLQVCLRIHL